MLPKISRADRKTIEKIWKVGRSISTPLLSFKFIKIPSGKKISVIAPKGVAKTAVSRNSLRRQGYRQLQKFLPQFPAGIAGAVIFRSAKLKAESIAQDLETVLKRLK